MEFRAQSQYGPLQREFTIEINKGYTVLAGPNNVGKSAILQYIFRELFRQKETNEYIDVFQKTGNQIIDSLCLILPERLYVDRTTQTGSETFSQFNQELFNNISARPREYATAQGPNFSNLPKLLLDAHDHHPQFAKLKDFFEELNLPKLVTRSGQRIKFGEIDITFQGSGLRNLYGILSALTDPLIKVLLIDEPEISLEPRVQKQLRDLFYLYSEEKYIIVSTHSHLFLNRKKPNFNIIVDKADDGISTEKVTEETLGDLVFDLLGCSVADLFFPENYVIVEGASDQVMMEKALKLIDAEKAKNLKVVAANSVGRVNNVAAKIEDMLRPILAGSPYKEKVVVLVDKPNEECKATVDGIKKYLKKRCFILKEESLEESLPDELYQRAGLNKVNEMAVIKNEKDYKKLFEKKKEISTKITEILTTEDLETIPEIKEAAEAALK